MIEDYDGQTVIDAAGEQLGTVERSFVDDTGSVKVVEVKMGRLRVKHRLIPLDEVERTEDGLHVPYAKEVVEQSPDVSDLGETLDGGTLDVVLDYYEQTAVATAGTESAGTAAAIPIDEPNGEAASTSDVESGPGLSERARALVDRARDTVTGSAGKTGNASRLDVGETRDLGGVIEIPIVEERLVKRPVVKEVLRVRKSAVGEEQAVQAELRKEDVETEADPGVTVQEKP